MTTTKNFSDTTVKRAIALSHLRGPAILNAASLQNDLPFLRVNGLAPWCFYQVKKLPGGIVEPDVAGDLRQDYLKQLIHSRTLLGVYQLIQTRFDRSGLPMVALKGMALAHLVYPDSALRPMGDIDLLVPEGSGQVAIALLRELGARESVVPRSKLHEQTAAHMRAMVLNGALVEVHQRLFAIGNRLNLPVPTIERCFNVQGASSVRALPDDLFAYHLAAHAYYGYSLGGMRLGWLLDMALLLDRQADVPGFIQQVIGFNPLFENQLKEVFAWAEVFRESMTALDDGSFPSFSIFRQPDEIKSTHRKQNIGDIWHTPGVSHKLRLLGRELFPTSEYMKFRYGKVGWRAYWERLKMK